ncbi:MAG: hypothetical protein HYW48_03705 [Deltaproteobacteria bacterium]|nr:hypothetical protein [Deltaproteobacteria bacterium]
MMDVIPALIDGAVVVNLVNACQMRTRECDACANLLIKIHNWLKQTGLEYVVFDLLDEKEICPTFLHEVLHLRKRLPIHFLFAGVMSQAKRELEAFNYGDVFPIFLTPEDAIRALRMQHPGVTEAPTQLPIQFGESLSKSMDELHVQAT